MERLKKKDYLIITLLTVCVNSILLNLKFVYSQNGGVKKEESNEINTSDDDTDTEEVEYDYKTSPWLGFTTLYAILDYPQNPDVIFVGDSFVERADYTYLLPEYNSISQGIGGDTTIGVYNRLEYATQCNPQNIVIEVGINDIVNEIEIEKSSVYMRKIIEKIKIDCPNCNIVVMGVLPLTKDFVAARPYLSKEHIKQINDEFEDACSNKNVKYIDMYSSFAGDDGYLPAELSVDTIHLRGDQYLIIKEMIKKHLVDSCYSWGLNSIGANLSKKLPPVVET